MKNSYQILDTASNKDLMTHKVIGVLKKICLLFIPFIFTQCSKDNIEFPKEQNPITYRLGDYCEPGTYTVDNGRLVFDDEEEYIKTLEFLACATVSEIDDWSREIEIETAGKAYRYFMNEVTNEVSNTTEYEDLIREYSGKIIVTPLVDSADSFSPLFKAHEEFCNLDGEFGVNKTVIKVTESKIINIADPLVDPSTVDDQTVTDTSNGIFVLHNFSPPVSVNCCPNADTETNLWAHNPRRRLVADYSIIDASTVQQQPNGLWTFTPVINVKWNGTSQKRAGIWPVYWWNLNAVTTLILTLDISFTHNFFLNGITSPITIDIETLPPGATSKIKMLFVARGVSHLAFAWRFPVLQSCVSEVEEFCINTAPATDVFVEINCP